MTSPRRPGSARWQAIGVGAAAVGACAVCCAAPILTVLGGLSVLSAVGAVWVPALIVVAIFAALALLAVVRRRRASASCAATTVDLQMPTVGGSEGERTISESR
ncbi:hypothetical protein SIM91_02415 [Rhodococcus opacus]|uniref:Mercuric ion transport protein n=1 Tax=Rhodococcus pseudokoreensis TaxID=2811421 RepID=A0A974VYF4_9NOCA|nr:MULTISPECIES: hypothetical protein [Rhodococcus]MDX5962194.1 hypothetical protein [Rhodococcus opacus]QSE87893.1 hypothetical protein JWS13_04565 [Rhodococcus pseudokoreensis]CAG7642507.1 hypothetical protein E143388_08407 [Rhodococcus opacus]